MIYQEDINHIKELLSSNKKESAEVLLEKIYLNNPNDFFGIQFSCQLSWSKSICFGLHALFS